MANPNQVVEKSPAEAVALLQSRLQAGGAPAKTPVAAVVLGSGVSVLDNLVDQIVINFQDVFGMSPGVAGHSGTLSVGRLSEGDERTVAVLRGRFHLYEGYPWEAVTLAARTIVEWGVPNLLLTNAAGGLNQKYHVGDLMVLTGYRDHISPKWKELGLVPAVQAKSEPVANALTDKLLAVGKKLAADADLQFRPLQAGVYAGLLGPSYETMAEINMLRKLQADAVGMSTVPELLSCAGGKTMAAAVSVITNVWSDDVAMGGHEEVLEASKAASKRLDKLFRTVLAEL
ncbi:MAG: purine-nucleoside phosphorylase [Cyanobacteria bacterium SZAS TMP-1]|nr:purine-nucleoside phosphorylase [Cyanobacteria bacterium SZAS TMP-1]